MHHNGQQVSLRVYRDVALASFYFLARIVTALPLLAPSWQTANQ
jgi:hypothetical protein